ncbi:MAG TPA: hypothetical protein DCR46_01305, partial [Cytophagales bacterium]|nr:hypothetical protein [Cytophagales bacterium]
GANTDSLVVAQAGAYKVRTTLGTCSATSNPKNIGIRSAPSKPLLSLTGPQQVCQGRSLDISITNFGSGQDQWLLSNNLISTNQTIQATGAGFYKVKRTTASGCNVVSDSINLSIIPATVPSVILSQSASNIVCAKTSVNYSAVEINAGTTPIFQWFVNGLSVQTGFGKTLQLDTLTKNVNVKVVLTSSDQCALPTSVDTTLTTLVATLFKVNPIVKDIGCLPVSPAIVNLNVTGAVGKLLVSGDLTKVIDTVTVAKSYQVSIIDSVSKCRIDTSIVVKQLPKFVLSTVVNQPICSGNNGSISINFTPNVGSFGIVSGNLTSFNNTNLPQGSYTIGIIDSLTKCTLDTSFTLVSQGDFTTQVSIVQPDCGLNNGEVNITTVPMGSYTFTGSFNSASNTNVAPGIYSVTTSNGVCIKTDPISVPGKPLFSIIADVTQPVCGGSGVIKISTSPAVVLKVSGSLSSANNTNLTPGSYNIRITDSITGCFKDTLILLKNTFPFSVSATKVRPTCKKSDGALNFTITPGFISDYSITGALTSGTNSGLAAGDYKVTFTQISSGCAIKDTVFTLTSPADFTLNSILQKPFCGNTDGQISLLPTPGPVGDYVFKGALSQAFATGLPSGVYPVSVISKFVCVLDTAIVLGNRTDFDVTANLAKPTCTQKDGSIQLNVSPGATSDYDFSGDLTSSFANNLGSGSYRVIVKRKNSTCFKDTTFVLNQNIPFSVSAATTNPTCNKADGAINLVVSPIGVYNVSGELSIGLNSGLVAKSFPISILSSGGCKKDTIFTLRNQPDFTVSANIVKSSCGQANGSIELKVSPAAVTDEYDFGGDFTSNLKINLARGTYRAVVTRQGTDCVVDKNFILTNQTDFTVNANITKPSCNQTNGTILLSPSQGAVVEYEFSGDFISETKTNVGAGDYLAVLTNKSNSCAIDTVISVDANPDFTVTANIIPPSCNQKDAKIDLDVVPIGTYNFSGNLTSNSSSNLSEGTFSVTIARDGTRCKKDTSFNVVRFKPASVILSSDNLLPCKNESVTLKAVATPSDIYTYKWYANDALFATTTVGFLTGLNSFASNEYKVEVRKGNECPGVDSILVKRPTIIRLRNTGHYYNDEKQVRLDFKVFNPGDIPQDSVYIFRRSASTNWVKLDSVSKLDTVYYNKLSSSKEGVYYYKIGLPNQLNVCADTVQSHSQRNIQLAGVVKDAQDNQQETILNWNSFVRWDSVVAEYQVWRSLDGGPLTFYVSGNLDTLAKYLNSIDAEKQCFRIRAIEKSKAQLESWSNTVCLNYSINVNSFNVFTPNGDGQNDVLYFTNLHLYKGAELHVFNRWGNKVFESKNYSNDWDGGGLPAGTYYYILDLKDGSKPIQRDVLLHR